MQIITEEIWVEQTEMEEGGAEGTAEHGRSSAADTHTHTGVFLQTRQTRKAAFHRAESFGNHSEFLYWKQTVTGRKQQHVNVKE